MTDWLPMVLVLATGTLGTLWSLLVAAGREGAGRLDLRAAQRWWWATTVATAALYVLYLVAGERWIWY